MTAASHERADVGPSANLQTRTLKTLDKRPLITQEITYRIGILSVFSGALRLRIQRPWCNY